MHQRFGGAHTDLKLDVLRQYLSFFTSALCQQDFELWYIDGFAGTGGRLVERMIGADEPLLGREAVREALHSPGSAQIAMETAPSFERLIFIEKIQRKARTLIELLAAYPGRNVEVHQEDANHVIQRLCKETAWRGPGSPRRGRRAVLFLDPFGMSVDYQTTLRAVAGTKAIDVWYLFPLSGLYRQASHSPAKIDDRKRASITKILGTDEWQRAFYAADPKQDLFGGLEESRRTADVDAIEAYVKLRLEDVFPAVAKPLRLYGPGKAPIFSLFFAMSNPDGPARGLALRGANHILNRGISSHVRPR